MPLEKPLGNAIAPARAISTSLGELAQRTITIAIDTEYVGPHTLTVQAACRLGDQIVVKLYRSVALPPVPQGFRVGEYIPAEPRYRSLFTRVVGRKIGVLRADLSPLAIVQDLLQLRPLRRISRREGGAVLKDRDHWLQPINGKWNARSRRATVPAINLVLVGHFLPADFGRVFGRAFFEVLLNPHNYDRSTLVIPQSKVLGFAAVGNEFMSRAPIVEYAEADDGNWFALTLAMRDLMYPFGSGSLDSHSQTFLGAPKSLAITAAEKVDMLTTFREKTKDAYGYAIVDAVNTLLIHEQMEARHREIFTAFHCPDSLIPPMRGTCGRRTADFLVAITRSFVGDSSRNLATQTAVATLMQKGSVKAFENAESHYGAQTGNTHGGLLFSRSPTRLWHEAPGQLRDVDMAGCYNRIIGRMSVYWGRPVVLEPGQNALTLANAVQFVTAHTAQDGWFIRVTGDISTTYNTLIPSTLNAVTSENYQRRGRATPRALPRSETKTGSKLFSRRIESGIVTASTWAMVQSLPPHIRAEYEDLTAESLVFYPAKLVGQDAARYDELIDQLQQVELPWHAVLDMEQLTRVTVESLDDDYVSLRLPLHEYAERIAEFRRGAQQKYGKGSGADVAWKLQANTMYGVLASPHLPTQNVVAANQVTATARAQAFALMNSLNGLQVITDGCTYRRDRIPACTYAQCLEIMPDYPLRHADDESGIPFLAPEAIPKEDAAFTRWYRDHVVAFFEAGGGQLHALLAHVLEHKLTGKTGSPSFDALACDGAGNYLKCERNSDGTWQAHDIAGRGFGRESKTQIIPWMIKTYRSDELVDLPPITEDTILLKQKEAQRKAEKLLKTGVPRVLLPLGMPLRRISGYKPIKPSAFIFQSPAQRDAILKQVEKFHARTSCGLEVLALRRAYKGRRRGSLFDLLEKIYQRIQAGDHDLAKALNLARGFPLLDELSAARSNEFLKMRKAAEDELFSVIDVRSLPPEALTTGIVISSTR